MLFEHQYKNKLARPLNVTFAVPQSEEVSTVLERDQNFPFDFLFHIRIEIEDNIPHQANRCVFNHHFCPLNKTKHKKNPNK